ncbi:hypothetical protein [Paenibacillus methanolicus]|uniref:Uncharacterized protein n=1 Tax=Paenibacillus methanolicus TaxID=582686 RepID=A0A5S5C4I4_9BACL|nr:hypothetical protein [Paenibacillus methanolicus]TYP73240.1 hypothetical protein BCM02_107224 [Paenibacillus methanolicus]
MVFLLYLLINAGVVYGFFRIRSKQLAPLEILFYWCIGSMLVQNYSALQTMNFKSAMVPDQLGPAFAHLLNRTVLYPVLTLLFLHTFKASKGAGTRLICLIGFSLLMYGFEYLSGALGVFVHLTLKEWWAMTYWLLHNLIMVGIMILFRNKLQSGGAR